MKYFSFRRNHKDVLITLMVVIFLGAAYFYLHVPQNEKLVQEQRFRSLQNTDKNIHSKIDNSIALMKNLLRAYHGARKEYIEKYIKGYSKENFTLSVPETQNILTINADSAYNVTVNNNTRQITLLAGHDTVSAAGTPIHYQMDMKFSFEQFIKSLLPPNVFDQYIVFSNGQVVYEDFSSGIAFLNDSLSGKKEGIISSGIKSLNVSGKDYKLFFQPVSFTADKQLVVTGLLSNKNYQQEKNQLPSQAVLTLLTIVFIVIVAYPWIKLYQMGNTDRLTFTDGIATAIVSMLLMSLLFFSFVKYNIVFRPDNNPDSKEILAKQIALAFKNETDSVYKKIHLYDEKVKANNALFFKDIIYLNKDSIAYAGGNRNDSLKILDTIAQNNLVNSFDDCNLNMLLAKGVIIRADGTLKLFNKGFRKFILTAIGNTEAMKIKNLINDNGNWSKLKNPLMIVIVAILIFLLVSQEEAYSKLITYMAALGAGIPAVIKLFSLFDNSNSKS